MHPSPSSVCSIWPERPVLPCVDPSVPQAIPAVCVRRTSISVQVLPFGLSLSPRVFTKVAEAALVPLREQGVCTQLPRRLAHTGSVSGSVMQTQGFGALAPQPVGPSGQLGKEQTLADAEDLFSRYGVWILSIRQRASCRNALSRCWTAWIRSRTGRRHHWNSFRGSWGIWRLRRRSHRWGCSIWDRFNTGSRAESRGGRGRAARCGSKSLQPSAKPSPRGQTFHSFGQEWFLLLWSRKRHSYSGLAQLDTRRAVTSCAPRRVETPSPDGPADLATFWTRTGRPVRVPRDVALPVVLLPDRRNTRHGRAGTQLAAGPSQVCISPSEPSRTDTVQGQGGRGADPARSAILAHPDLVPRADAPRDSPSLADSSEEGSTASETGHPVAPASRPLEISCLVPGRDSEVLGDLPQEGVYTITSARTLSTWHAYALKLNLLVEWCSSHREDPGKCPIRVVLSFLQQRLERRLSPSILKCLWGYDCCQPWPRG